MRVLTRATVVILGIVIFGLAGQTPAHAAAICGGVDKSGKLTEPCKPQSAKKVGKPLSQCKSGSFPDIGANTYGCWSCPGGFSRDIAAVDTDQACSKLVASEKPIFTDYKSASRLSSARQCPHGSFFDPRNGGECWKCPANFGRNTKAVTADGSCSRLNVDVSKGQVVEYRNAVFTGAACGEKDGFWDPIDGGTCWSCPAGYERTIFPAVTSSKACGRRLMDFKPASKVSGFGCKVHGGRAFWDPIDGGSCWTCPKNTQRGTTPVNGSDACRPNTFQWEAAEFFNPGLFGFGGATEVALKVIRERRGVEAAAVRLGAEAGLSAVQAKKLVWEEIKEDPASNMPLAIAVLEHILNLALNRGAPAGSPEATLIANFEKYIRDRRIHAAQEALNAYDNWSKAQTLILADRQKNAGAFGGAPAMLGLFSDQTPMPPDFSMRVAGAVLSGTALSAPMMAGFATNVLKVGDSPTTIAEDLARRIFNNRTDRILPSDIDFADDVDDAARLTREAVKEAGKRLKSIGKTGLKFSMSSAKLGSALLTTVGPQVVIQIATLVLQAELEKNITKAEARPKLERLLDKARRQSANLKVLSQDKDRAGQIHTFWSMAVTGTIAPNQKAMKDIGEAVEKALNPHVFDASQARWYGISGNAAAIGAGANGEIWHVGGGGSLYRANAETDGKWYKVADSGVAEVAPGKVSDTAFVLMDDGSMADYINGRMRKVPGRASDIAFGGGVRWHVGGGNTIYRSTGGAWRQISGKAKRIAATPDGNAWAVGTDDNIYRFDGRSWKSVPGKALDIAAGPDGVVWHVGTDNRLYRFTGNGEWMKFESGNVANIAGGIGKSLWARRSNGQIIAYVPFKPPLAPNNNPPLDTTTTRDLGGGLTITSVTIGPAHKTTVVDEAAINHLSNKSKKWEQVPGWASDISIGASGDVWHVGGSGSLYVMSGGKGDWKQVAGSGVARVAAMSDAGKAFVLMTDGKMREVTNGKWRDVPGWASDIAVSADGRKWHIGRSNSVYHDSSSGWKQVDGEISRIAGARNDIAWAVGTNTRIYRFDRGSWKRIPGQATEMAVGADGSVWHIGGSDTLYRLENNDKWKEVDAKGKVASLSVGANGEIWVVRPDGKMAAYR